MSTQSPTHSEDQRTADAFATSWNSLREGTVYTPAQYEDWMAPLKRGDIEGRTVLELGCGNGSLLVHTASWEPASLEGVDLGASVLSATRNLQATGSRRWKVTQGDLVRFESAGFDVVYCIGVLHHLKDPHAGFMSVVRNTRPGGRFHCWVYAKEGNAVVIRLVDPIRRVVWRLPWRMTKFGVALPLAMPFYLYAKAVSALSGFGGIRRLPLHEYSKWIARREFRFFWHVAFDQLVTPQTAYLDRATLEHWLGDHPEIERGSAYVSFRNGNSWKFGGRRRAAKV